ncbi:hypothetical protein [Streptomyces sp. STCH 565 A]|uniref:hypothetical protein n=1 Tax=Streptomyces sp. STCH 565 A TaxID=2950532 RepID=UPI002075F524|nr:hypothetical protein [Streptomyces sp. STCH 565 A]MCM8548840.1 hypothetical protein [Streptomyces sp. STCH 565 A]
MTVSLEKAISPEAAVAALKLENERLNAALELVAADLERTQKGYGSLEARYSNIHGALQREQEEARAAREKYSKLRYDAHQVIRALVEDYDLGGYREEISEKIEEIGLDSLEYSYEGEVTVTFNFEGLRKRDGSEIDEETFRAALDLTLRTIGDLDVDNYTYDIGDIDIDQE